MQEWELVNNTIGPDVGSLGNGIFARKVSMDPDTGMESADSGSGWDWSGIGSWAGDNLQYLLRAKIDAEYKQPFQLANRQMDIAGMDGDVAGGSMRSGGISPMWMLGGAGALVLLVLLLKD